MAIGAITLAEKAGDHGPVFHDVISFAGDGAYPTGGTAAFLAAFQAKVPGKGARDILAIVKAGPCGGYEPVWDNANAKLMVYFADANNAADAPSVEVPNATDLSGVTFRVLVISK